MSLGNASTEYKHRAIQTESCAGYVSPTRTCIGPRCRRVRSIAQFVGDSQYCKTCAQDLPK